jgi:hypothetical protein
MTMAKKMLQGAAPLTLVIPAGGVGRYVYANALIDPDEVGEAEAERLVTEKYLRWVEVGDEGQVMPLDADGSPVEGAPTGTGGSPAVAGSAQDSTLSADPDVLARREAAQAKLPQDGSMPDGRAAQEVWVEYAVRKGYDRETVEKSSKDDIRALFKG